MSSLRRSLFQTSAHAKCILAGEHVVLNGCPAIVLPVTKKSITLTYQPTNDPVYIANDPIFVGSTSKYGDNLSILFRNTLQNVLQQVHKDISEVHGKFLIENHIEIGGGLGFSAAFCVIFTRWLIWNHWLEEKKLFSFARQLEDIFHGKSSGADIAGAIANHIIHFEIAGDIYKIEPLWKPKLYLSYSGCPKKTDETINKVKAFRKEHPELSKSIDNEMRESVLMIEEAFKMDEKHGLPLLRSAILLANHCFEVWGLNIPELKQHFEQLYHMGAIAIKSTGAGGGGYVLSLWETPPPLDSPIELIPLFE